MNSFLKRLLTVLGALFLLGYVVYQAYQTLYTPIQTETVYTASLYETVDTKGIAIRNEMLVTQKVDGYMFYTLQNGSRVAKDGTIANIYSTQQDASSQQMLDHLDEQIALLKSIQGQGTANRTNLSFIDKQIEKKVAELVYEIQTASFTKLDTLRTDLLSLLNKQQVIMGRVENFNDKIAALQAERAKLAESFNASVGKVKSPAAGYFVGSVDGYENTIRFDTVASLTVEDIQKAIDAPAPPVESKDVVGKIVGGYEWYFACNVPAAYIGALNTGAALTIKLPFVSESDVPVTVASCNRDKTGQLAVIFRCENMSEELSSMRIEQAQIQLVKHTGLRVPKEAIVTNDAYETGVYVRVGNMVSFRKIEQEYNEAATYSICKEIDTAGYLKLYDDVILGGKGLYDGKIIS